MKKVLLTGATGFIGRQAIAPLIERGYEVHAVYPEPHPIMDMEPEPIWQKCDLLDPQQRKSLMDEVRPSHLLHFAWYVVPKDYRTSLENFKWVDASINLIIDFADSGGERIVSAGTCFEYDWQYAFCSERLTPKKPSTIYGTCKHCLHQMMESFSQERDLSSAWGRIFFLYGPHEYAARLVPAVITSLLKKEPAPCSHGEQVRDFLYVGDVADAFTALLDSDVAGAVNIASGNPVQLKDIIFNIAEKLDATDLVRLGAIETSPGEVPFLGANVERLHDEVGWSPRYDLDRGIDITIDWWKEQSN